MSLKCENCPLSVRGACWLLFHGYRDPSKRKDKNERRPYVVTVCRHCVHRIPAKERLSERGRLGTQSNRVFFLEEARHSPPSDKHTHGGDTVESVQGSEVIFLRARAAGRFLPNAVASLRRLT